MADPNTILMQKILAAWGVKISAACAGSSVPPAFLAALIANESGGNASAKRFEPLVCGHLAGVISGQAPAYDVPGLRRPLTAADLLRFLSVAAGAGDGGTTSVHHLADVATSYGLTQIMGFHVLAWDWEKPLSDLVTDPATQLQFTITLLAFCAQCNSLDLAMLEQQTAGEFFTWWNCGRVNGRTFDPMYVSNGLDRMRVYNQLLAAPAAPVQ